MELPKRYEPHESEEKWLKYWEKERIYSFHPEGKEEVYSIDTPPPTVSGKMHLGHSFSYSQQDFIARFQRMLGKNVFYPFGTDDNGLATERMIEKTKNVKGQKMERKEFVKLCLKTLEEIRPDFVYDWKRIGVSADYNIFYTTINEHSQKVSQKSFIELYKMGRLEKKKYPIMFCPNCLTAIAQVELKDAERESQLVNIQVEVEGSSEKIVFATTRPELIYGCVGISFHPDDKRYKHLSGKKVRMPITGRLVEIIPDKFTDIEYGSGLVYYCTYGSVDCIEWMQRHPGIKPVEVMGLDGKYNELSGRYKGMRSEEARKKVIEDLQKEGAIAKLEKIKHVVNTHERCETDIEYVAVDQWFIKYLDLKADFIKCGRKIKWYPEHMRARYENWIDGLKWDWNISRQRHFGVPIPVWYCRKCGEITVADEKQLPVDPLVDKPSKSTKIKDFRDAKNPKDFLAKCKCGSNEFIGEKDVLDTWATSSLTPDIAAELFKDKPIFKKLLPMDLRPQAHDIITFWLFNTVVKGYFHHNNIPWKNAMISGWALDPHGKKMSKSKGNVIDPREMIKKYSADALRFWAAGSRLGDDLPFQEKDLVTGTKFTTKIWNASKFAFMHLQDYKLEKPKKLELIDKWILSKLSKLISGATENFMKYEYSHTKLETDKFFWHTFADNYLEIIKDRLYNADKRGKEARLSAQYALYHTLLSIMKLMAPITPFITEELYQHFFKKNEKVKSIHLSRWPSIGMIDEEAEKAGDFFVFVLQQVRKAKSEQNLSLKKPVKRILAKGKITLEQFNAIKDDLTATATAEKVEFEQLPGKNPMDYEVVVDL